MPELCIRKETARSNPNGMDFAIEIGLPKTQESIEDRKFRRLVELLPDICLKEARMIGQVIENFRSR